MAEGKQARQWDHTATLAALIVNSNPYRTTAAAITDFHPYMGKPKKDDKPLFMVKDLSIFDNLFPPRDANKKEPQK